MNVEDLINEFNPQIVEIQFKLFVSKKNNAICEGKYQLLVDEYN